MQLKF